jgi:hypothetical protein
VDPAFGGSFARIQRKARTRVLTSAQTFLRISPPLLDLTLAVVSVVSDREPRRGLQAHGFRCSQSCGIGGTYGTRFSRPSAFPISRPLRDKDPFSTEPAAEFCPKESSDTTFLSARGNHLGQTYEPASHRFFRLARSIWCFPDRSVSQVTSNSGAKCCGSRPGVRIA